MVNKLPDGNPISQSRSIDSSALVGGVGPYGIHFDPALRDEVVHRVSQVNVPSYTGFVMPKLEPVVDSSGEILDVLITYPQDFTQQMLEYSGKR